MITKQETETLVQEEKLEQIVSDDSLQENADITYLQYSAEAVGYGNRELQWSVYRTALHYIPIGDSILDFGCGRGDLYSMHLSERGEVEYVGVDMNEPLINAGKEVYPILKEDLILKDWFKLPKDVSKDWCVNVGSCNLRYDADTVRDDFKYLCDTIDVMYDRANKGIVLLLTSWNAPEGLIQHDPGKILNWCQKKYGNVVVDHTVSRSAFCLIIKK